jgi:leucyl-tRNA synthetase
MNMKRYNPSEIEPKWQKVWADQKTYKAHDGSDKPPYYALSFFPYPSGAGLHIGHVRNFTITDVAARFKRMQGFEVLHPMGYDAFGLPAENYAIKTGVAPQVTTKQNTENFHSQAVNMGLSIDWDREFSSTDPDYYKWTQWFFLLLHKKGLAYRKESLQFWCETDKTVLANEQVEAGRCWRCGNLVTKKSLNQWFFKITDYADRLEADLDKVDWPHGITTMQKNWIGRSKGAEVRFAVEHPADVKVKDLTVFTTRPDTLFGATFLVVAPEHDAAKKLATDEQLDAVAAYIREAQTKTDIDRMDQSREKTGVFTGSYAINPVNGAKMPIWIADYVLVGYGTGAIMAVPAHDERDNEFAKKFELPIIEVIEGEKPDDGLLLEGVLAASGEFDGMPTAEARERITQWLVDHDAGSERTTYKIRDWLISRQRYWGAPIPMIHCQKDGIVPVPDDQLPVLLPTMENYQPTGDGRSPLANNREWVEVDCPKCGGPAERETDTMDGFACSSWYALRFADPRNNTEPFSRELVEKWAPVDLYVGGAEHAVMHLLYARMWTKVMFDDGLIGFDEPFTVLRNQGMLVAADGRKFSKSAGNGVDPDDIIKNGYGADALRTVMMFLAPFDQKTPWSPEALGGIYRFLNRVWTLAQEVLESPRSEKENADIRRVMHKTTKRVTDDMHQFGYNTAIAALMEATNDLYKLRETAPIAEYADDWKWAISVMAQLLAPFAPHVAEELWSQCGREGSVHLSAWPEYDEKYLVEATITVVVQVNGKVRATLELPSDAVEDVMREAALAHERVRDFTADAEPKRVIVVPGKLVNIVL